MQAPYPGRLKAYVAGTALGEAAPGPWFRIARNGRRAQAPFPHGATWHVACRVESVKYHRSADSAARSRYLAFISGEGLQPAVRKEIAARQPTWERYRAAAFAYLQRLARYGRRA